MDERLQFLWLAGGANAELYREFGRRPSNDSFCGRGEATRMWAT